MKAFPVFCGSALKNRGVQALLDGVIDYLPSPSEAKEPLAEDYEGRSRQVSTADNNLRAFAFKYIYDSGKMPLTYVRVYSGKLRANQALQNTTQGLSDKPARIYRVQAGQYVELSEVGAGDIAALAGLKHTRSGETLVHSKDNTTERLAGLTMPPPVFFCSIQAVSEGDQPQLEEVLSHLVKEDPSLVVRFDEMSNSIIVTGQGELHLEVLRDRLWQEFKIKATLGPMQVSYRESVRKPVSLTYRLERNDAFLEITLELSLRKRALELLSVADVIGTEHFKSLHATASFSLRDLKSSKHSSLQAQAARDKISRREKLLEGLKLSKTIAEHETETLQSLHHLSPHLQKEMEKDIEESLTRGCLIGYPVIEVQVSVVDGLCCKARSSPAAIREAVANSVQELLMKGEPYLLEPLMKVQIKVPEGVLGEVLADLTCGRRGEVVEVLKEGSETVVSGRVPLSEMVGYSSVLRSLTRGAGGFTMEYESYGYVGDQAQQQLLSY
jgi:elongation factor G